jgi:hypothetical protein
MRLGKDDVGRVLLRQRHGRRLQHRSIQPCLTMDLGRMTNVTYQWTRHPRSDRDPGELGELDCLPGVARRLLERGIAEDRGESAQIQYASTEKNGHYVVMTGVAVDDGGWFHAWIPLRRCR